jgi:hypothetical protein
MGLPAPATAQLPAGRDDECSSLGDANDGARPLPSHGDVDGLPPACCAPFTDLDLLLRIISWTLDLRNISRNELLSTQTEDGNSAPELPTIASDQLEEQSNQARELMFNYYLRFLCS